MMTRISLRLSLLCLGLSFALVMVVHAASYDHDYVALIAADFAWDTRCATACFMGIETDTMTGDDVRRALNAHPWAAADFMEFDNFFVWSWSGEQPSIINETVPGVVQMNRMGVVEYIVIETHAMLYHVEAALGQPDSGVMNWAYDAFSYRLAYHERGLRVVVNAHCPVRAIDIPTARTAFIWQELPPGERQRTYQPPHWNIPLCAPKRSG